MINAVALRTLFLKEVKRFSKVWQQTVMSPLITTSLYFLVFGVALGARLQDVHGVPYIEFVIPGLIMLAMITNSFLNAASSLFQSKINGTIVDLLVAPIGTMELVTAYVAAATVRASIVGVLVYAVAAAFTGPSLHSALWVVYFGLSVTVSFSLLGLIAAIWAEKFDHLSLFPNFILTPLTFLGGVFYSIEMLPAPWDMLSKLNPILYVVSGLRYGLLGSSDVPVAVAALAAAALCAVLLAITLALLSRGYKLRT
jgi:ABC-2 type transport system permease protein